MIRNKEPPHIHQTTSSLPRGGERECRFFSLGVIFTLALLSLRKNVGLLVVYIYTCIFLFYLQGKLSLL